MQGGLSREDNLWHAKLHCQFGSDEQDREPDQADKDAVVIIKRLMDELRQGDIW